MGDKTGDKLGDKVADKPREAGQVGQDALARRCRGVRSTPGHLKEKIGQHQKKGDSRGHQGGHKVGDKLKDTASQKETSWERRMDTASQRQDPPSAPAQPPTTFRLQLHLPNP